MSQIQLSVYLSLLPILAGVMFYARLEKVLKLFFAYSIFLGFTEWFVFFYALKIGNNMFLYPYYGLIQFFFIATVFKRQGIFKRYHWVYAALMIGVLGLFIFENFLDQPKTLMPFRLMIGTGFITFFLALLYFYDALQFPQPNAWKKPVFFMVVSLMVYGLGNVFYFLLFNATLNNSAHFEAIHQYHEILNCVFYLLNSAVFYFAFLWRTTY